MTPLEIAVFACLALCFFSGALVLKSVLTPAPQSTPKLKSLAFRPRNSRQNNEGISDSIDRWIAQSVRRSGWKLSSATFMLANTCVAVLVGAAMWVSEIHSLLAIFSALVTFLLGLIVIRLAAKRRAKKFSTHFPVAIELMARSMRAGESLEESIQITADSCQEPVDEELQHCAKQLNMGLAVHAVMAELAERMPTMEVRIFAHTISMHRETGGRLSDTLDRLAKVIRQRTDYLQKIKTMTELGRFAAVAIGYMGVFVLAYLSIVHPEYINKLWSNPLGQRLAIYAIVSEIVGIGWVALTLKSEE